LFIAFLLIYSGVLPVWVSYAFKPRLAEPDKIKRKVYTKRKQMRDKLEFYHPRCKRNIRALKGSRMFEACFNGEVSFEEAKKF